MKNQLLAAGGLLLVILICVALIHYEAEQTRDTMRAVAKEDVPNSIKEGISGGIGKAGADAVDATHVGNVLDRVKDTVKDTVGQITGASDTGGDGSKSDSVGDRVRGTISDVGDVIGGKLPGKNGKLKPEDAIGDLFNMARDTVKTTDQFGQELLGLSVDEEREWGKRLHEEVIASQPIAKNSKEAQRLERLAAPLLDRRKRKDLNFTFNVIESDDINAFSILGGYIYFNVGLLNFAKTDEEVQFVLGHEIAHVDLGHCTRQATYSIRASSVTPAAGGVVSMLNSIITRAYTKDQEYDADAYSLKALTTLGQSRETILSFPRRLTAYFKAQGIETSRPSVENGSVLTKVKARLDDHFQTHPPSEERVRRLETLPLGEK